jgi:thiamine thiazole synthase
VKETIISNAALRAEVDLIMDAAECDVLIVGSGMAGLTAAAHAARAGLKTTLVDGKPYLGGRCWERRVLAAEDTGPLEELGVRCRSEDPDGLSTFQAVELAVSLLAAARQAGVNMVNGAQACDLVMRGESLKGLMIAGTPAGVEAGPGPCFSARALVDATGHDATLMGLLRRKLKDFYPGGVGESFVDAESACEQLLDRTGEVYPGLYAAGMSAAAIYHLPRAATLVDGLLASGRRVAELIVADLTDQQEPE